MKKLPIIRHIRAMYLSYKLDRWVLQMYIIGLGMGYPNESDLRYIKAVWDGEV